jgi:glycosyltransferase involved in cell wall biosynthesis
MKKLLFINHSKFFGGAQRSLYEVLNILSRNKSCKFWILTPTIDNNNLLKKFNNINFNFLPQFYNGYKNYYRKLRWFLFLREILYLILFFFFCFYLKFKHKRFDVIYFNDITLIPCLILKFFFNTRIISALRSLQRNNDNLRKRVLKYLSKKYISKILAIDNDIIDTSYAINKTIVCRNIFSFKELKIKKNKFIVSYIGTMLVDKGIKNFEKIAKYIYAKYPKLPIYFYIWGNPSKGKLKNYLSKLFYNEYYFPRDNKNIFHLGQNYQLNKVFQCSSIITFFGDINSIGRPVIEGGFFSIPSIVFLKKTKSEYIIDGKTGYMFKNYKIINAAEKIVHLYKNKKKLSTLGKNAKKHVNLMFNYKKNYKIFEDEVILKI